jgi:hypothetical protein
MPSVPVYPTWVAVIGPDRESTSVPSNTVRKLAGLKVQVGVLKSLGVHPSTATEPREYQMKPTIARVGTVAAAAQVCMGLS